MFAMKEPVTLAISSGKGGVGKTSLAVNLAFAMAREGRSVLVVDGDLGLANVDVLLRLSVAWTIQDLLDNGADPLKSVIYPEPNVGILPASSGVPEMVGMGPQEQSQLREMLKVIGSHFDYVLMDTAAGIGSSVLWFNNLVHHNIVLVTPDPTSLTDAYALIKILSREYDRERFYIVLNCVRSAQEGRQTFESLHRVAKDFLRLDLRLLGTLLEDRVVRRAVRDQAPFVRTYPQSPASQAMFSLSNTVLNLH
jgi:flagellar biosynthesis protein FlhG